MSKCTGFKDFFEIRFKADNVQQRPIGYFCEKGINFIILIWAIEKGNKLKPEKWCEIANRRRKEIISGQATTKELKIEGN